MRIGIIVPHLFMHREILPKVIFSPAQLALDLAEGLKSLGEEVTLFTPGPVDTTVPNITADLSLFEAELAGRGDTYVDLLKKHPMTFVTLARQVQAELIAKAYAMANSGDFDVLHVYTNEEEQALIFAKLCHKPVVFTHHDPFNFLIKYKSIFPKYSGLPFISLSYSQRLNMPADTNWVANIYHGLAPDLYKPINNPKGGYVAYFGRIIEPKGVHLAIQAINYYNTKNNNKLCLRIAGKHYGGHTKDTYWQEIIEPQIDNINILYDGFINTTAAKNSFLGNASALMVPSIFDEPFGMVCIEALACGTPVIGLDSGAIPEIINDERIGQVAKKMFKKMVKLIPKQRQTNLAKALENIDKFDRTACRIIYENNYTTKRMCQEHLEAYR